MARICNPFSRTPHPVAAYISALAMSAACSPSGALAEDTLAEQALTSEELALAEPLTPADRPFWDDASLGYFFRTASFKRSTHGDAPALPEFNQRGVGTGGWLYGTTGEFANLLSFGGSYYFTVPLDAPEDHPYNFILRDPNQDGYSVIAEAYAKLSYEDDSQEHVLMVGRQSISNQWFMDGVYRFFNKLDQSMVGRRDIRGMHPITYEAITLTGRLFDERLRYYAGYVTDMKQVNDIEFRNLYQGVYQLAVWPDSAKQGDSDGMTYFQINWKPQSNTMVSASYHLVDNLLNMGYLDLDHVFRFDEDRYVRIGTQGMYQESNGDSLVSGVNGQPGDSFSTAYGGIYLEARPFPWWIPYGMAGIASDRAQIRSPYSIGPSYLIQRVGENSAAGEHTWILGTVIDFSHWGLKDLSLDVTYGERSDRNVDGNPNLPLADWNEAAGDLIYIFPQDGPFKNLRARARYARVWQSGDQWVASTESIQSVNAMIEDIRFDIQLNIPFF
ncbi:hypothetical protein U5801_07845 [Lamprobacter modestohalophilus]|uniref:hypothetical protein n=1 Tax=Lamprobacter modestohalophilus TaxID=1064514 RepID=UPI002ADEF6FA|nr:hypothetical protein [Lamprobacter modestohalophilus]MEA1049718.1 hypothetical protein [Lamprobacter modestohalophilus]